MCVLNQLHFWIGHVQSIMEVKFKIQVAMELCGTDYRELSIFWRQKGLVESGAEQVVEVEL